MSIPNDTSSPSPTTGNDPATPPVDPIILAVDTSATRPGLAIRRGPELLASLVSSRVEPHSRTLFDNLSLLLGEAQLAVGDVDIFAVVTGPGSFTGLRVGLAAMKGLAATRQRPLYGMDLLELHARALGSASTVLVISEAGRGEIYCGLRRLTVDGAVRSLGKEHYGRPESSIPEIIRQLDQPLGAGLLITGDGVERSHQVLAELALQVGTTLSGSVFTSPASVGWQILQSSLAPALQLSLAVWQILQLDGSTLTPICQPFYIRPSDAEINWSIS